jgi:hypothetical protein
MTAVELQAAAKARVVATREQQSLAPRIDAEEPLRRIGALFDPLPLDGKQRESGAVS